MSIHRILAAALAIQAGLTVVTWWPSGTRAEVAPQELVSLDADAVTALEITGRTVGGGEPDTVTLRRLGDGWTVETLHGYPADEARVDELLRKLLDLQVRAPVATQPTSHARLEVADDAFTRKVRIEAGGESVELFVGASRGRDAHVRRGDQDLVHAARGLSAWSIADSARSWIDTQWLDVDREQVTTLSLANAHGAFTLEKEAEGWSVPGAEEAVDADVVEELLQDLLRLRIRTVAAAQAAPEHGLDGSLRVSWTTAGAGSEAYEVGTIDEGRAYARRDGAPFVVELSASAVEKARDTRLTDLLVEPEP